MGMRVGVAGHDGGTTLSMLGCRHYQVSVRMDGHLINSCN